MAISTLDREEGEDRGCRYDELSALSSPGIPFPYSLDKIESRTASRKNISELHVLIAKLWTV